MVDRKSNQGMCNVHLMCDAGVITTETIKVLKIKEHVDALKRKLEKWKNGVFATVERSDRPSKSVTKDWNDEKHQRGIKKVS